MVEFRRTETVKSFNVSIIDDQEIEHNETFTIAIVSKIGMNSEPREAIVTIIDNDAHNGTGRAKKSSN